MTIISNVFRKTSNATLNSIVYYTIRYNTVVQQVDTTEVRIKMYEQGSLRT